MSLLSKLRRWLRERRIIRECGNIRWCPVCRDPLNDQVGPDAEENCPNGEVRTLCLECGSTSWWRFDAPAPILVGVLEKAKPRKSMGKFK